MPNFVQVLADAKVDLWPLRQPLPSVKEDLEGEETEMGPLAEEFVDFRKPITDFVVNNRIRHRFGYSGGSWLSPPTLTVLLRSPPGSDPAAVGAG